VSSALATPVKQIAAGVLDVGYADVGPADGPAVVLLHGWPYDIHTFDGVSPLLSAAGYRVIVPYLRGYGTTRFLSDETFRNGQQSVLAVDTVALMDVLGIEQAVLAGADWGRGRPMSSPRSGRSGAPGSSLQDARDDCLQLDPAASSDPAGSSIRAQRDAPGAASPRRSQRSALRPAEPSAVGISRAPAARVRSHQRSTGCITSPG
jgi:pimeloyl-ACP methyl ester carboxylesterase